jgi:sugar/nucleoside kinase (ribokinase family)
VPPLAGPLADQLADPCADRHQVQLGGGSGLDVFLSGTVFMDVIFTGLSDPPMPGTEVLTSGLGSAPGGVANLAVALSRLGLKVGIAAAFGDDMFGGYLWRTLAEQEGVDLSASRQLPGWPTPVTVSLSDGTDRSMITYSEPPPVDPAQLVTSVPPVRACFSFLGSSLPWWVREAQARGATVFADVGWDPSGAWSPAVLDHLDMVDVFLPNAAEAMSYTRTSSPEAALAAMAERAPVCVVKAGSNGALGIDSRTGERASAPALPVAVLDPTGAGDVFDAGFIFGTLAGWPLAQRLKFANLCAGLSVRHHSGSLGAPCWGEIADWGESQDVPAETLAEYAFVLPYIPDAAADTVGVRALPTVRT